VRQRHFRVSCGSVSGVCESRSFRTFTATCAAIEAVLADLDGVRPGAVLHEGDLALGGLDRIAAEMIAMDYPNAAMYSDWLRTGTWPR